MRPTLLLFLTALLALGGCKRASSPAPDGPTGGPGVTTPAATAPQTTLAGDWTGQFVMTHADGIALPPNMQLAIPAALRIMPAGAVTIDMGGGKQIAYQHEGQLILNDPLSSHSVSLEVVKMAVTAERIDIKTRSRSALKSLNPEVVGDTSKEDEMTFLLKGDTIQVQSSAVIVTKSKRSTTAMGGTFRRVGGVTPSTTPGTTTPAVAKPVGDEYYPLKVGTVWRSKSGNNTMVVTAAGEDEIGGARAVRLETSHNGRLTSTEHLVRRNDGYYRLSYNGLPLQPSVLIFRLPPKSGDSWNVELKAGGESGTGDLTVSEEAVTVPAGKFATFKVLTKVVSNGNTVTSEHWYAKGVGVVKQRVQAGPQDVTFELEKFEPGR